LRDESLTFRSTFNAAVRARQWDLNGQFLPYNSIGLSGVADAFVFEFMGLAMIALCHRGCRSVAATACPRISDY
jgi:hypothetical protein